MPAISDSISRKLGLLLLALLFAILVIESALSIGSYLIRPRFMVQDSELGWKYRPTQGKLAHKNFGKGVVSHIKVNSQGFRDEEFNAEKDVYKVMMLGDSMTLGAEVSQEEIFPSLLEEQLKAKFSSDNIDVLNFGITGYGTVQELLCFEKYGPIYQPQALILMFYEGNDFSDNINAMSSGRYRPTAFLQNDRLVIRNSPDWGQKILSSLIDKSVLLYLIGYNSQKWNLPLWNGIKKPDEESLQIQMALLKRLHQGTAENKISLFLFYIRANEDPAHYNAIEKFCRENNIFIKPVLLDDSKRPLGSNHMNKEGHFFTAQLIMDELMRSEGAEIRRFLEDPNPAGQKTTP